MNKLYVIVRNDISPGLQCAQSCHALYTFTQEFPELTKDWKGNLVVLQVPTLNDLEELDIALRWEKCGALSRFEEPDLDGELTAIATSEGSAKRLSNLPLALRPAA